MDKHILDLHIRILSPVHIGASQEKHLVRGVDYLIKGNSVFFIDERKIINDNIPINDYTSSLAKGDLGRLLDRKGYGHYASKIVSDVTGEIGTDIKTHIKSTFNNKPYIPGSSLKGSIRSVLMNKQGVEEIEAFNKRLRKRVKKKIEPFGRIQEDPFRYIIIGDTTFNRSKYFNTKTFNLMREGGQWVGAWKNILRNGNSVNFSPSGFTFPYECIPMNEIGNCRIVLNKKFYENAKPIKDRKNNPVVKQTNTTNSLLDKGQPVLFEILKQYMKSFLDKEIKFFKKYSNEETDKIIDFLTFLKSENEIYPVVRLGQGSGFHSITGDTHYDDHTTPIENNQTKKYKSRKMAFCNGSDGYDFFPMGFIQLIPEDKSRELKEEMKRKEEEIKVKIEKEEKIKIAKIKEEKSIEEERLKPKMINKLSFKKNKSLTIDAKSVGSHYSRVILIPFVEEFKDNKYEVVYPASMELGTIVQIRARLIAKGKKLQLEGRPTLKK